MEACAAFRTFSPARLRGVASAAAAGGGSPLSPPPLLTPSRRTLPLHDRRHLTCAAPVGFGEKPRRRAYDGLLLDAGGTLLQLARPVAQTYLSIGRKYAMVRTESEIKQGFKRAFAAPWTEKLRYEGDGRPFWRHVVVEATGCRNPYYFEEVYEYFANGVAWHLPTGAYEALSLLKDAGVKLAVVSNFDTRLRKLLNELNVTHLFDAIIVSSEIGYEKPDVKIFTAALEQINVKPDKALHVGDDEKNDKDGARAAGIDCLLWGSDVKTFAELYDLVLVEDS